MFFLISLEAGRDRFMWLLILCVQCLNVASVLAGDVAPALEGAGEPDKTSVLRLAAEDSWPPFSDMNGKGMSADIVSAAYAAVGREVEYHVRPYSRVLHEVRSGQLDAGFNVTRQATTEVVYIFGQQPILFARASFFFPNNSVKSYTDYAELPLNGNIGIINGYEYGDIYETSRHRFQEHRVNSQTQIIGMLMAGRLDMAIMFDQVAAYTLKSMGLENEVLRKGFANHRSAIYVVFSRKNPHAQWWADKLDEGMLKIKASGVYAQIVDAY